jgi:predicted deacylase
MAIKTRIGTPVDFDADGKQCEWLRLPFSSDLSAYGFVPIPIVCIKNGDGPTALLIAGNHGDEYEGQVALGKLARETGVHEIQGRLIILPALNFPAVEAGRRVSPLDEGNLNRMFPGDAAGSPTQMIAHYVSDVLLPLADLVIDLHSGGRSLHYLPCALVRPGKTDAETAELIELVNAFGAPITSISDGSGGGGATTLSAVAHELGIPMLTTELGGGATLSCEGLHLAEQGLARVLRHYGFLPRTSVEAGSGTRLMKVDGTDAFTYATHKGIFEPAAEIGETVAAGQPAGAVHPIDWPLRPAEPVHFRQSGMVACRRAPSLTLPGDCLFKLMVDADADSPFRTGHAAATHS